MSYTVLEQFYKENRDTLVKRVSFRVNGDYNAEDVVQEAFVRAIQYWDSFDPERKPIGAWFNTILNNASKCFMKDERHLGMALEFDEDYIEPYTPSETERETIKIIKEYIKTFDSPQRDVLELYFFKEYRPKEIHQVLDVKIKTINTWTYQAKLELARMFDKEE